MKRKKLIHKLVMKRKNINKKKKKNFFLHFFKVYQNINFTKRLHFLKLTIKT